MTTHSVSTHVLRDDHAPADSLLDPMVGERYVIEEAASNETVTG